MEPEEEMVMVIHGPIHDRVLSDYFNMEIWSHTSCNNTNVRYQAVCVECRRGLCDFQIPINTLEDARDARVVMVDSILANIERGRCACGQRWRVPEFDAAQAVPLINEKRGARLDTRGKLYAL